MKKLTAALTLLALMITGSAFAAETATTDASGNARSAVGKEKRNGKDRNGDKQKRPKFEECDKDRDGALNLEEYLACFKRGTEESFAAIDADKDGKLGKDELRAHHEARKSERRREVFDRCDTNKDGMLSFEEFEQCAPPKPDGKPGKGKKNPNGKPARP